jgi:hypothetical protein
MGKGAFGVVIKMLHLINLRDLSAPQVYAGRGSLAFEMAW